MSENDPQLPDDLRRALKKSPTFTPPESFYKEVLEKVQPRTPWYWGYPARGLATACILLVMVLAVREKQKIRDQVSISSPVDQATIDYKMKTEMNSREKKDNERNFGKAESQKVPMGEDLAASKEVQKRLDKDISGFVENPSPFEEDDVVLRKQLQDEENRPVNKQKKSVSSLPPAMPESMAIARGSRGEVLASYAAPKYPEQARETVSGIASQNSFDAQQLSEKPALQRSLVQGPEWAGQSSGITAFRTVVVRSRADWDTLWLAHTNYIVPPPPTPSVDFDHGMIIGVFAGSKPSAGYEIKIVATKTLPDKMIVFYRESTPPTGMANAAVMTQPYALKVIPKTFLPITFSETSK